MRTPLTSAEFGRYFQDFKSQAFRLETLDQYSSPSEQLELQRFLKGEPLSEAQNQKWVNVVKTSVTAGKSIMRVHVITFPLSSYLQFEIQWGYAFNDAAGERIYLLDRNLLPNPAFSTLGDFWLFDETILVRMQYDSSGVFSQAERDDSPQAISTCITAPNELLKVALQLRDFLARQRSQH